MKKFLSLALALIMVMSLVTVGAGAAFTDAEEITNTEAVEVMSALGILSGSNGAFDPTGTLTRGAAAKIIAYMVEGTAKADAIKTAGVDEAPFSDVPTTSSTAPFIAWAANKGIVGGYSDGTFQRSNPVSGNAFVKMVLVALGVTDIDFTAKGWQIDAIARAEEMKLLEGIADTVKYSDNLTRENAAQIAFNAMQYVPEGNKYWYVGDVKFETATDAAVYAALTPAADAPEQKADLTKSLAGKNYKLAYETIIIKSNQETVAGQKTTIATAGTGAKAYSVETAKELVGHKVNVWFKDADADNVYDAKEVVYSVVDLSKVVTVAKEQKKQTTEQVEALLGIEIETDGNITAILKVNNYVLSTNSTANITYAAATETYTVPAGDYIICDEAVLGVQSNSTSVKVLTVTVQNADKGYYTVNDGTIDVVKVAEKEEDCINKSLTEVDWLELVEEGKTSGKGVSIATQIGQFYSYEAPAVVTGTVTKTEDVADSAADIVYIDGVKYTMAADAAASEALDITAITLAGVKFEEYNFYLDGNGKIFGFESTKEGATTTDASLIIPVYVYSKTTEVKEVKDEYGTVTNASKVGKFYTIWVQGIDMAGEVVNLQVVAKTKITATTATAITDEVNAAVAAAFTASDLKKFHTYTTTENDDGEAISTITKVATSTTKAHDYVSAGITNTAKKLTVGTKSYYLTEGFQVIYLTGTGAKVKVTIKEGTNDQIVAGAYAYGEKKAEDTAYELKYILVNEAASTTIAGEDLAFVNGTFSTAAAVPYTKADGKTGTAYEQTIYINGEKKTIITTGTQSTVVTGAGFYTYEVDELGLYTFKALTTEEAAKVVVGDTIDSIYKGMITIDGKVVDVDVTGAKLVNLVKSTASNYSKIPTDPAKLAASETISFVLNEKGTAVELIYITASSRSAS